ncbi:MAG: type 1 glutamine amidotransferase [candidate division Zixibacteria bacterium]|nr:type 1 glutamine amidotransferase [candidate division Zixibacteria bacterium]
MKPILIIQNVDVEKGGAISDFFTRESIPYKQIQSYAVEKLPPINEIRAVVTLGAPFSANDAQKQEFTKEIYRFTAEAIRADIPYLGICYGSQLLAKVLGAAVVPHTSKEIGASTVRLTEAGLSDPLFAGFDPEFPVFQWHGEAFKLPFGSSLLCEGAECKNQAFRKRNAVGIQFHLDSRYDEIPDMCRTSPNDLADVNKSPQSVIAEFETNAARYQSLNDKLLKNFLGL